MKRSFFETLISLMLGASWAFIIIGSALTFNFFSHISTLYGLATTLIFIFIALFMVLVLEAMLLLQKRQIQAQEQNRLLKRLLDEKEDETVFNN